MLRALYAFDVSRTAQRIAFAGACLALAGMYSLSSVSVWRAHRAAESLSAEGLQRAVELQPGNASYWSRLGRYRFFVEQDVPGGLPAYQEAVRLNPHSARYWLDLAGAYAVTGKTDEQAKALEQAVAADPKSVRIAWEAGNFYLVRGDTPAALRNLRVVVEGDPQLRLQALRLAWRTFEDPGLLIAQVLPLDPAAYWDLLRVTLESGNLEAASTIWKAISNLDRPFSAREGLFWVDAVLNSGDTGRARQIWTSLAKFDSSFTNYLPSEQNSVINGSFEEDLLNAGFDWRYEMQGPVKVSVDRDVFHFGTRSIRLDFDGHRPSRPPLRQIVRVEPGRTYDLSGFLKAEHLRSAVGASLVIADSGTGNVLARSAPIDGTTGWVKRSASFTSGPDCSTVEVGIGRAYETNTLMVGSLWLDDLELTSK